MKRFHKKHTKLKNNNYISQPFSSFEKFYFKINCIFSTRILLLFFACLFLFMHYRIKSFDIEFLFCFTILTLISLLKKRAIYFPHFIKTIYKLKLKMRVIIWMCMSLTLFGSVISDQEYQIPYQKSELSEEENQYKQFVVKYREGVENPGRKLIFLANLRKITAHNERFKSKAESYEMSVNEFTDWVIFVSMKLYFC